MIRNVTGLLALVAAATLLGGCAGAPRALMPTPVLYQQPGGETLYPASAPRPASNDIDLLYITDRRPETEPESTLPYGEERADRITFGTARVRIGADMQWDDLVRESKTSQRAQPVELALGPVTELGAFPREPYPISLDAAAHVYRQPETMQLHRAAKDTLRSEIQQRLADTPRKEVILYVHGFNETFETAAFTTAELCHFLGRESLCSFFTWPASSSGNFLISYSSTTESARYAVGHLKKTIRMLATTPGVERVQLLAHSRGTSLLLDALRELLLESISAGQEPVDALNIDNVILFSPDIDVDVGAQAITSHVSDPDLISVWPSGRLPRSLHGRLTIYASPSDRALLVSRILFRSESRIGNLRAEDISEESQLYLSRMGKIDLIVYEGERTDAFGHSYFTTNPRVSSDVIAMLRYRKKLGDPGRELLRSGPMVWKFPPAE
jgi:esterase/lipase superfamily enzyme